MLAGIALFAIAGCGAQTAAIASQGGRYAAGTPRTVTYAVYAWNAGDVISRWKGGPLWSFAQTLHVKTFMLGFTDADIATYSRANGSAQTNAMIAAGKRHGVAFELLLGDPDWIPPSGVPQLERILQRLRSVHFAGHARRQLDLHE